MRLFLATVTLVVWTIPAAAQWLDRATPGIPRTPDGKPNLAAPAPRSPNGTIDFSGIWNGPVPDARIKNFDRFAVIVEVNGGDQLVFKHAIATISTSRSVANYFAAHHV